MDLNINYFILPDNINIFCHFKQFYSSTESTYFWFKNKIYNVDILYNAVRSLEEKQKLQFELNNYKIKQLNIYTNFQKV